MLYDTDDVALAREVRADKTIAGTRLILMTAGNEPINEERLREAGVQAYLAKPVGQPELFDALTIALAKDALPLARPLSGRWRAVSLPPPPVPPEKRRSVRVLLVEDNFQRKGSARIRRRRRLRHHRHGLPDADHGRL